MVILCLIKKYRILGLKPLDRPIKKPATACSSICLCLFIIPTKIHLSQTWGTSIHLELYNVSVHTYVYRYITRSIWVYTWYVYSCV